MFVYIDQPGVQTAYLIIPNSCIASNNATISHTLEGTDLLLLNQNSNGYVVSIELKNKEYLFASEKIFEFSIEHGIIKFVVPGTLASSKLPFLGLNLLFKNQNYEDFIGIEYIKPESYGFGRLIN